MRQKLADEIETMKTKYIQLEKECNDDIAKYAEDKQGDLDVEFHKYRELLNERQLAMKEKEILNEKKGSILEELKKQSELIDKDFLEKQTEVNNVKSKNVSNFGEYKKELDKKSD